MRAMVLRKVASDLVFEQRQRPVPGPGEIRIRVEACAVCRTDLHVIDGDLLSRKLPLIPGHEIVGHVEEVGPGPRRFEPGHRVGLPWLGHTCGICPYCASGRENLCDYPQFTGYTRDGGFASHVIAEAAFAFDLEAYEDPVATAPLMCAGLIGWRSLVTAGPGKDIGIYGFGAAAHIITQVCRWQGRNVFAFTRTGDKLAQNHARSLGAVWAGGSDEASPEPLDAAIIFAPVGDLVPVALRQVKKGGRVVCGGIYMSTIPSFPYRILWEERQVVSVANLTRKDGIDFLSVAKQAGVKTDTRSYPLEGANEAIAALRAGHIAGAAVLVP